MLDATLEDDLLSLCFDGLKRVDGPSKLGDFHYVPMLFHEGRKVGKEQRLLLESLRPAPLPDPREASSQWDGVARARMQSDESTAEPGLAEGRKTPSGGQGDGQFRVRRPD